MFYTNIPFSSPLILSFSDPVLAPSLGDVGQEVTVVGFGTTNTTTKVQSGKKEQEQRWCLQAWADILQMASIKIVSASSCQAPPSATSSFLWDITGDQICARGADKETSRNCFRDSCQVFTNTYILSYLLSHSTPLNKVHNAERSLRHKKKLTDKDNHHHGHHLSKS